MTSNGQAPIQFRDRATGEVVTERVFGEGALRWLYHSTPGRALTWGLLARRPMNHMYGWINRGRGSKKRIANFIATLGIDASEAEHPVEHYETLDDFFTRHLKPEARPIDREPDHLVSPADGRVLAYPCLRDRALPVKGSRVPLDELLLDRDLAARYADGAGLIVRLAPADYHRFHFPEGGNATGSAEVGSKLHSVHPIALDGGAPSFLNKRTICRLATIRFGELLLMEIGAMCVGTIVQTYAPGRVDRGQEKGYFRFGGSTFVLLAEPGKLVFDEDLVKSTEEGLETLVRMGSRIGRKAGA